MRPLVLLLVALLLPAAALAGPLTITDSRGPQTFEAPPERIVALSWSQAEQVIELGLAPVGVADPEGYRAWVVRPPLPEDVADVGLRQEPNLAGCGKTLPSEAAA